MVSKGGGDRRGREDNGNEMGWERKATRGGGERGKEKQGIPFRSVSTIDSSDNVI